MNKEKGRRIGKIILKTIYAGGILSVALIAPNALQALKLIDQKSGKSPRTKYYINNAFARLIDAGFIEIIEKRGVGKCVQLTDKGKETITKYELEELTISRPKKWDGMYRVVIFDIAEYKRSTRDLIRKQLTLLGFERLQNSVWVHPFECKEVVIMLKANTHLGKEVLYMTVNSIENDKWLIKKFGL